MKEYLLTKTKFMETANSMVEIALDKLLPHHEPVLVELL